MAERRVIVVERKKGYEPVVTVQVKSRKNATDDDADDDNRNEDHLDEVEGDEDDFDSGVVSSHGADRLTDIESRVSKSVHRVSRSLEKGVSTYLTERDKSTAKRRDGAIVDLAENVSVGVSTAISEAAPVLTDVAEAYNTIKLRRLVRRAARVFGKLPFIG